MPEHRQVRVCQQRRATSSCEEEEEPRPSVSLQVCYFSDPTPRQMVSKVPFLSDRLGLYTAQSSALTAERRESVGALERQKGSNELVEGSKEMRAWG